MRLDEEEDTNEPSRANARPSKSHPRCQALTAYAAWLLRRLRLVGDVDDDVAREDVEHDLVLGDLRARDLNLRAR